MIETGETCETCKHFDLHWVGIDRINPPSQRVGGFCSLVIHGVALNEPVGGDYSCEHWDWCGEWKQRDGDND